MMALECLGEVYDLIQRHRLHDADWPVDLTPLESEFVPILRQHMPEGVAGFAVMPRSSHASKRDPAFVVIDQARHKLERRLIYAHEVGHVVCGHPGTIRNLTVDDWFHDRQEIEAWTVAALLLIPIDAWGWGDPVEEVAARCGVPVWVAKKYPGIWVR